MNQMKIITTTRLRAGVTVCFAALIVIAFFVLANSVAEAQSSVPSTITPFEDSTTPAPPSTVYAGPLFKGNYDYPTSVLVPMPPSQPIWREVLKEQPISSRELSRKGNSKPKWKR